MSLYTPTLQEAQSFRQEFRSVPIRRTLLSDLRTPIEVLRVLKNVSRHCYLLESLESSNRWGRYTFLGYHPSLEITCVDGTVRITENSQTRTVQTQHPGGILRQIIADRKSPKLEGFPTFTGGLVGYFSYDFIKYAEPNLMLDAEDQEHFNDFDLMLFDKVICFDNLKQQIDVYKRQMQDASNAVDSAMVAVVKLPPEKVEELAGQFDQVYPVNYNSPAQTVCAGLSASMEGFKAAVKEAGGRALPLKVSGAFHLSLIHI